MLNSSLFSEERKPLSRNLLLVLIILSVLSVFLLHLRSGVESAASVWLMAMLSALLYISGWYVLDKNRADEPDAKPKLFNSGMLLATCGALLGIVSSYLNGFGAVSIIGSLIPLIILMMRKQVARTFSQADLVLTPVLCASVFWGSGGLLGDPLVGVFPAVIVLLMAFVIQIAQITETEIRSTYTEIDEEEIFHRYRKRFAWTASIFFLFGVVSFWPWLGMIYNDAYFWLLIFGVILPMVFFWGRLRQPRAEGPYVALLRFNRVSPLLAGILLIAFAIG